MTRILDSDGAQFVDGAEYVDRNGDAWRAVSGAKQFQLVRKADGSLNSRTEDAFSVVRGCGPMVRRREENQ